MRSLRYRPLCRAAVEATLQRTLRLSIVVSTVNSVNRPRSREAYLWLNRQGRFGPVASVEPAQAGRF